MEISNVVVFKVDGVSESFYILFPVPFKVQRNRLSARALIPLPLISVVISCVLRGCNGELMYVYQRSRTKHFNNVSVVPTVVVHQYYSKVVFLEYVKNAVYNNLVNLLPL